MRWLAFTYSEGRKVYALGGGLYGNRWAAIRYSAIDAMAEMRKAMVERGEQAYGVEMDE